MCASIADADIELGNPFVLRQPVNYYEKCLQCKWAGSSLNKDSVGKCWFVQAPTFPDGKGGLHVTHVGIWGAKSEIVLKFLKHPVLIRVKVGILIVSMSCFQFRN